LIDNIAIKLVKSPKAADSGRRAGGNMNDMQQNLSTWRAALQEELAALEQQASAIRTAIAEKRAKVEAIDRLIGTNTNTEKVQLAAAADESVDDAVFTPVKAYWRPILEVLVELGGRARRKKVIELVGKKMKGILTPADYAKLNSNWIRWENRVVWQASNMRRATGLIKDDSPRGLWEITDVGREWLDDHG
jgi:restriction endonuclease Mrr